ncbi:amidase family protein [Bradyrhizobium pachyrhizi]|uniref:amidase family protein n=1 Tax=Bradyrhizobium pachyrhizi TaxID=280333 RepID=UPI000B05B36A|nr:amidase family protein [Bradyrhizobium pachyrhizi]
MSTEIEKAGPDKVHASQGQSSIDRRVLMKGIAATTLVGAGLTNGRSAHAGNEAHELGVRAAALAIKNGTTTSEELATRLLRRAREHSDLDAFITIDEAVVLRAAKAADNDRAAGKSAPLLGVPLSVKDSYMTRDLPTTFGTAVLNNFRPSQDAPVVQSVRDAGGLVFGKNNLVEMSYGLTGANSHHGQPRNPYNKAHVTGGSSSGVAASVAARLVPAALGGDTVGSIRVPASLCGVVGFKPTQGRWSGDLVAPISGTLDTTGVLARSVGDCAYIDAVVTKASLATPKDRVDLKGIKLGYAPKVHLDVADADVEKLFRETLSKLKDAGAEIVEIDLGQDFSAIAERSTWGIFFHETKPAISDFLKKNNVPVTFEQIYEDLTPQIKDGWSTFVLPTGAQYFGEEAYQSFMKQDRPELKRRYRETFAQVDALVFPTTPCTAPRIDTQWEFPVAGKKTLFTVLARNTFAANCAELPGISIPMGLAANNLPVGLELDAGTGRDSSLLEIAQRVEAVVGSISGPA